MRHHVRQRFFVDRKIQLTMVSRVVAYWLFCLLSVWLMLVCWEIATGRPSSSGELIGGVWSRFGPALIASILLVPLVVWDCLRVTNRFAGPLLRLRRGMSDLADGEPVQPLELRQGDFLGEIAEQFNRIASQLQAAKSLQAFEVGDEPSEMAETSLPGEEDAVALPPPDCEKETCGI